MQFALDHFGRVLIGDEMGVGKTIQALAIAYLYRRDWPVLIITPSSLKSVWRREILKWLDHLPKNAIQMINQTSDAINHRASFTIVSYSLASKMAELL